MCSDQSNAQTIALTAKERNEASNFQAFLRVCPNFTGRPLTKCQRGGDPPDFLCLDSSGKRIGVELTQWVNEQQMAASKTRERLEKSYLRVIRSTHEPPPTHIGLIWLSVKGRTLLDAASAEMFRQELYGFIAEVDAAWPSNPDWNGPQGCEFKEFTNYPCLSRHLEGLDFYPRKRFTLPLGAEWITFPAHGGAYSPEWMRDALVDNVRKKIVKYSEPQNKQRLQEQRLDEFCLVAYYDEAVLHNSPYHAPGFGLANIAEAVRQELAKTSHPFDKVFLFSPIETTEKVLQVWPNTT